MILVSTILKFRSDRARLLSHTGQGCACGYYICGVQLVSWWQRWHVLRFFNVVWRVIQRSDEDWRLLAFLSSSISYRVVWRKCTHVRKNERKKKKKKKKKKGGRQVYDVTCAWVQLQLTQCKHCRSILSFFFFRRRPTSSQSYCYQYVTVGYLSQLFDRKLIYPVDDEYGILFWGWSGGVPAPAEGSSHKIAFFRNVMHFK